jgi:hypothetical protein
MINHIYVIDKTKLVRAKVVTFLFIAKRELVKPFKIKVFVFFLFEAYSSWLTVCVVGADKGYLLPSASCVTC